MLNAGYQSTTGVVSAQIILICLRRHVTIHVSRKGHDFDPVCPGARSGIIIVRVRIRAAWNCVELRIVFIGQQTASVIRETLIRAVLQLVCNHLAEAVVNKCIGGDDVAAGIFVIRPSNTVIPVASMIGDIPALVRDGC
jgi:hypothetical protein